MSTLTAVREATLINNIQSDSPHSADFFDELIRAYRPIISHLARKLAPVQSFYDDLYQEGFVGLIEAIRRFDLKSGHRLSTFAFYRIRGQMMDYLRDAGKYVPMSNSSFDEYSDEYMPSDFSEYQEGVYADQDDSWEETASPYPTTVELLLKEESHKDIRRAVNKLSERQRQVMYLAYWKDLQNSEIANILGISRPRITKLLSKGLHCVGKEVLMAA